MARASVRDISSEIWCSIGWRRLADALFSTRYLAGVNTGTPFRQAENVLRSRRRKIEGGEDGDGGGTGSRYLCNPGTASWEMVREAQACIPGHVLSLFLPAVLFFSLSLSVARTQLTYAYTHFPND